MRILVAMDAFKGSLSSLEAGRAAEAGIRKADGSAKVEVWPLADGGEGTVEAITQGLGGKIMRMTVTGPLGLPVSASYGIVEDNKLAVLEMASAAGLTLAPKEKRNPLYTTSFGVGEMIADAFRRGCRQFIVGIGGSATNDGGMGMLKALGVSFLNADGEEITGYGDGRSLHNVERVEISGLSKELRTCEFRIACDVNNPLYGENGAAYIYAPQKGADRESVLFLDAGLRKLAGAVRREMGIDTAFMPGAGAAGGLGYALCTFLNGKLERGIDIVLDALSLEEKIKKADYIVTGEGRTDAQTAMGKAPEGVARLAKKFGKKVIVLSGGVGADAAACNHAGMDAVFSILREPMAVEKAMEKEIAEENMKWTAEQVFRLVKGQETLFRRNK